MAVQTVLSRFFTLPREHGNMGKQSINMRTWQSKSLLFDKLKISRACPEKLVFHRRFIVVCINFHKKKIMKQLNYRNNKTLLFSSSLLFNCAWSMSWLTERVESGTWCIWVIPWNLYLFHFDFKLYFKHYTRQRMSLGDKKLNFANCIHSKTYIYIYIYIYIRIYTYIYRVYIHIYIYIYIYIYI